MTDGYWDAATYQRDTLSALAAMQEQADRRQAMALQEQAVQAEIAARQQEAARQEAMRNDWSAAATSGTPEAWNGLFQKYPDQYKALRSSMDEMTQDRRAAEVNYAMQLYAAPDLSAAQNLAQRRINALRAAGNEKEARAIEDQLPDFTDKKQVDSVAGSVIWGGAAPEVAKAFFEAQRKAQPKPTAAYDESIAESKAREASAKAGLAEAKLKITESGALSPLEEKKAALLDAKIEKLAEDARSLSPETEKEVIAAKHQLSSSGSTMTKIGVLSAIYERYGEKMASGLSRSATEWIKKQTGDQDLQSYEQALYSSIAAAQKAAENKGLGAMSNYEQQLAQLTIPDRAANPEIKRRFIADSAAVMNGLRLEARATQAWAGYKVDAAKSFTYADRDVPELGIKKGMSFDDFVQSQLEQAGVAPQQVANAAVSSSENVMPTPRPQAQGGLTPGQRIQMLKGRAMKGEWQAEGERRRHGCLGVCAERLR